MLNQKGIAFIPLLFWIAISVIGVAAVGEATGLHISLNNLPTPEINNSNTDLLPSVAPLDSPSPIPTVSPKVNNNQVDNSNSQAKEVQGVATHDGTRTGNIIKYKEWCKGNQEISVYENELITKKSSDGKTYTMTQGDWDCYEKKLTTPQKPNNQVQHSDSYCKNTASLAQLDFQHKGSEKMLTDYPELFSYDEARKKDPQMYSSDPNNQVSYNFWLQLATSLKNTYWNAIKLDSQNYYYQVYNQCLGS